MMTNNLSKNNNKDKKVTYFFWLNKQKKESLIIFKVTISCKRLIRMLNKHRIWKIFLHAVFHIRFEIFYFISNISNKIVHSNEKNLILVTKPLKFHIRTKSKISVEYTTFLQILREMESKMSQYVTQNIWRNKCFPFALSEKQAYYKNNMSFIKNK